MLFSPLMPFLGRCVLVVVLVVSSAVPLAAQDVVKVLQKQRERARVIEVLDEKGASAEPESIDAPELHEDEVTGWIAAERIARAQRVADSLQAIEDSLAALPPLTEVRFRKVEPHEQGEFLDQNIEAYWMSTSVPTPMDSVATLYLRGRLAMQYGTPTRNAAAVEQEQYGGSEFVQFEYWFVVNDSIPLMVLDRNGPEGMGLLVAGDRKHEALLGHVKAMLADQLVASTRLASYVDYYQSRNTRQWYRAGYDGTTFFVNAIRRPRWARRIPAPDQRQKWTIHR
ncbi:MAG: hypothetical protein AAFQ53_08760 [Bacteroidota bacterium]